MHLLHGKVELDHQSWQAFNLCNLTTRPHSVLQDSGAMIVLVSRWEWENGHSRTAVLRRQASMDEAYKAAAGTESDVTPTGP